MSETPEMVERVARALFAADYPKETWGKFGPSEADAARYYARASAVIEAMREPSEAMLFSADWLENGTRDAWKAMIDAALSEPTSSTA